LRPFLAAGKPDFITRKPLCRCRSPPLQSEFSLKNSDWRKVMFDNTNPYTLRTESVEETIFDSQRNERMRQAVAELPEIRRRRFVLYHEFGLTYEQIAKVEGCTKMPVKRSIDRAEAEIREKLKNF
jgi:RNA polymerase sigma factor (sigma-70 family)